ncbi:CPBP family intramembrane glutamic endopeptidase [Methylobacter sp.]|uniref:CPBP family intramembrane glutamic endopeptidase n=1 Tax=Methylobacter sp. TaxID=2051955 RepID=UPI002FDD53A7
MSEPKKNTHPFAHTVYTKCFFAAYASFLLPIFSLHSTAGIRILVDATTHFLWPLLIAIYIFKTIPGSLREFFSEFRISISGFLMFVFLGFAFACFYVYINKFNYSGINQNIPFLKSINYLVISKMGFWGVLYLASTAAIHEEWLYKWILIRCFEGKTKLYKPILIASPLFAITHASQGFTAVIVTAIYSMITLLYYYKKRNLFNLITMHFIADLFLFSFMLAWISK